MQNQKTGKKIILLDSINTIDKIKKELTNLTDVRIITFDYISHKNLLKNNITHEISDDFLDEKDIQLIQNESLNLTKWYDNELNDVLNYEEINLGRTFYVEFHQYLLQILKKILELKKITKELSNMELIVSPGLFQIAKEFHSSLRQLNIKIEKSESFLDDSIKFRITNTVKFDISKKSYQKLKKSSEKIFSNITSNEMKDGVGSILFIEFDPIKYRKLFEISKNYSLNLILFNRRRPSIWNLKSYKIIKNSSFIIADNIID